MTWFAKPNVSSTTEVFPVLFDRIICTHVIPFTDFNILYLINSSNCRLHINFSAYPYQTLLLMTSQFTPHKKFHNHNNNSVGIINTATCSPLPPSVLKPLILASAFIASSIFPSWVTILSVSFSHFHLLSNNISRYLSFSSTFIFSPSTNALHTDSSSISNITHCFSSHLPQN